MTFYDRCDWPKNICPILLFSAATANALLAQTFTTLLNFNHRRGANPVASLVQGSDGSLYGTTAHGGNSQNGTIFKITPAGTFRILYNFEFINGGESSLVLATNGEFYGTTEFGGTSEEGSVFKVTPAGKLTTLYSFTGGTDGGFPSAGLVYAANGNFYGTTVSGPVTDNCRDGCGTVFEITPSGRLTTLYSFTGGADGWQPLALLQGTDGNFYGTTYRGGASTYCGTVFQMTPAGTLTTLHSFTCGSDGGYPYTGLIQATDGNLYGTTEQGGAGSGTVFKITPSGMLTTLYSFTGGADGDYPAAGVIQATDGNFYGTTLFGGVSGACSTGCGTIFQITPAGTLTTLYRFMGETDGVNPVEGLVQATNGNFYGTTYHSTCLYGRRKGPGTAFSLSMGLAPFVTTVPTSAAVGKTVKILGTALTGSTSVTFNGVAATFAVNSTGTAIATTVPTGAATGTVQVVTPTGILSSNVAFRVR